MERLITFVHVRRVALCFGAINISVSEEKNVSARHHYWGTSAL